ncbi:MAG: right-handed parallel beta-helix repeat-containing protein [Phycisphaerae bacterium]
MRRWQYFLIAVLFFVATAIFAAEPSKQPDSVNTLLSGVAAGSVKDFGAVGDGRVDDTAAVEAAVKAGTGAVYFPKGNYRLTRTVVVDLNVCDRTSLVGAGTATVIMAGPGPAFHFIGTHDGTGDPDSVREQVWQFQRLPIISGFEIRGAHPESIGLRLEKTMQAILTNLLIRECKIGVELVKRNRNLLIDHCHIYHNSQVGIDFNKVNLHQAIIADSHISYNPVSGIRLLGGEMRNFQIVGNDIEYNYDPNSQGSADILIDMTSPGSSFREGTIVGNTIQARPSQGGANIRFLGGKNLKVGGLMAITGNLIGSQTHNIHLVNCRGVSISGNSLYSAAEHTLWLEDCANIVVGNNNIDWNPDHKTKYLVDGILIDRCKGVTLSNTIIENSFQGSSQAGGAVDVQASEDVAIVNCQVLDFRYRGITLTGSVRCRVTGCSVIERRAEPMKGASIQVEGGRDNLIADNIVNHGGLSIAEGTATVRGNLEIKGAN